MTIGRITYEGDNIYLCKHNKSTYTCHKIGSKTEEIDEENFWNIYNSWKEELDKETLSLL